MFYKDMTNAYLDSKLTQMEKDSVNHFMLKFLENIHHECCDETLACKEDKNSD
jgi:hypothetical protein